MYKNVKRTFTNIFIVSRLKNSSQKSDYQGIVLQEKEQD